MKRNRSQYQKNWVSAKRALCTENSNNACTNEPEEIIKDSSPSSSNQLAAFAGTPDYALQNYRDDTTQCRNIAN